jgi:hypothetical protein
VAFGFQHVPFASAQVKAPSQVNFQFGGLIPGNSTGASIGDGVDPGPTLTDHSTRAGGIQASYSYQFNE